MQITKLLVANRSEIATRVFRSATELGIRTVAIYTHEDRFALHRFKADEAYEIGQPGEPIRAYLDIANIIDVAKRHGVDAIHPGYGFLSEKPEFAHACKEAGITFVGPSVEVLESLGNKTTARKIAVKANVPILSGSEGAISTAEEGNRLATELGFPIILKAAHGGGGRGMRVVQTAAEFNAAFEQSQSESLSAFGSDEVFIEKFISRARHIEVQLLGDNHGNLVHLFERDCSVQRRHQKVVEIAPAPNLSAKVRDALCDAALAIGRTVNYQNAGTVEFLLDVDSDDFFFIEVNPRIQVEHTVTEQVTGIDIVKSQILIAQGAALRDDDIGLGTQDDIDLRGFALQCRVTTEDPSNNFLPDYGRISHYRSASGMGVRLDAGSAYSGAVVNPFYDSMLVKVTAQGRRFQDAVSRMKRCLMEFRVRGVKTNVPFLIKLMDEQAFQAGECTTRFIDETPELAVLPRRRNRATRMLTFLADIIVNGNTLVSGLSPSTRREPAILPFTYDQLDETPKGTRDRLKELGPEKFSEWVLNHKPLLITDTTFRDAHQSLLATRFRTFDLVQIAESYSKHASQLFSIEMWGGATFDTSMRFLKESPWHRLTQLREKIPNVLFQMLLRASNAVGYTNYPDNVVQAFVKEAADSGMDVFRVFDALNWVPNMRVAMDAVLATDAICEASVCYTGDILDSSRTKYDMKYYVNLAKDLEKMGAHILAIKDMAGLCKPEAARRLVKTLKEEIGIPVHFHTHDTAGIQAGAILNATEVDLDIADAAMAPMSGGTSQPNLNTIIEALRFSDRATDLDVKDLDAIADYWRSVREFYVPFESQVVPANADLYHHEMPGGQYTNLYQQARALGLLDQWSRVCEVYAQVNQMFGDIVKVTPTSKAVGDMALFMVANELTPEDVLSGNREIAYPASVIDLIGGNMGQPPGGFPEQVIKRVLKDKKPLLTRPGESMAPADFEAVRKSLQARLDYEPTSRDVVSSLLYPKVFEDYTEHRKQYYDPSGIPTHVFFYGMKPGEEMAVEIESGKVLIVKYLTSGEPHPDGKRTVFFEVNGVPRDVSVVDHSLEPETKKRLQADAADPKQIGSTMPGMVVTVSVEEGDIVKKGQKLLSLEAMKMETSINSEVEGRVAEIHVQPGSQVETGDLLVKME
ncbi:pyruvate carboxylase [Planctomycetota bacterium]